MRPVFPWEEVRIWSRTQESVDRFLAEEAPQYPHLEITGTTDVEDAVRGADVSSPARTRAGGSSTTRGSGPGTHLAALGADLEGEQELDPRISSVRGSSSTTSASACRTVRSTCAARGADHEDDIAGEIGKVICGELEGRQSDDQVTVFDSTGIALQDSATVPLEYERAVAAGVGVEKKMIST